MDEIQKRVLQHIEAGIPTTIYGPSAEDVSGAGIDKAAVQIDDLVDSCKVMALSALDYVTRKKETDKPQI